MHPTQAIIRLDHLRANFEWAKKRAGRASIIPVVKSNAYGHGLIPVSKALARFGAERLAVAHVSEGKTLRKAGVELPVLVLGAIPEDELEAAIAHRLTPTVCRKDQLERLSRFGKPGGNKIKIHLKFDTGMGRVGVPIEEVDGFLRTVRPCDNLEIEGVYSHYACADEPGHPLNPVQRENFEHVLKRLREEGHEPSQRHLSNSAGLLNFPGSSYDAVRFGIMLYGLSPGSGPAPEEVKPVMKLGTRICFTKRIGKGVPVSYGATWRASKSGYLGTVPLGYGDGFSRGFSSRPDLLEIGGKKYSVAGRVCMDMTLIDLGGDCPAVGEEVHVFGWGGQTKAEDHAGILGTIPYEIVTSVSERVERVYV